MARILGMLLVAIQCNLLVGCDSSTHPTPPANPAPLATDDFPSCIVTIDGSNPEGMTLAAGEEVRIEIELQLREGLDRSDVFPPHVFLVKAANNEQGEEGVSFAALPVDEEEQHRSFRVNTDWKVDADPGSYELRISSGLLPTPEQTEEPELIPLVPVFRATVEVQ